MPIRRLPLLLVNQIAAGEVIERPASVVKELVENSLDAGARRVDIAIEDGGRQLIRISDDGAGIPHDELPLAIAPHATSKLHDPEDLPAIATLGFRGEALASIASVSRLRLTSRALRDGTLCESGAVIAAAGDQIEPVSPVGCGPGTVVEVRDLFFNTPARRKFMRSASSEFGHIAEVVSRIAMARPDVAFSLAHNGRATLKVAASSGPDSRRVRCLELMGRELEEAMLDFELVDTHLAGGSGGDEDEATVVWGLAGLPAIARATSRFQYLFVNSRPVRDRNLAHAVKEAYRGLVPPDRQPVAVVFIQMPARAVDVNVHPAKTEVRFRDPSRVHGQVLAALRQRLLGADLTPSASLAAAAPKMWTIDDPPLAPSDSQPVDGPLPGAAADRSAPPSTQAFVDYFRRMAPQEKGFAFEQVRQALAAEMPEALPPPLMNQPPGAPSPAPLRSEPILQVHKSYVITQDEQGILIVDQHALHERVMFEELRQRVLTSGKPLESQRMLMPAVLDATPRRLALLETLTPLLARIGIEASPIGPGAVAVHAFPTFLFDRGVEPLPFMQELLDRAEEGQFDSPDLSQDEAVLHEVLDMMSCKAAIKAGDALTPEELASLLARREQIERSSNCPHGRPTTIRLSLRDLEKQFKRG